MISSINYDDMTAPELRFNTFDTDWEKVNLGEIVSPCGEKNGLNLALESYSITNEAGFVPQEEKFENGGTMKDANKSLYNIVPPNTFAYNPARINVGSIGYYEGKEDVIVSSLYVLFKTNPKICYDKYLLYWLKSDKFRRIIELYQEGGVRLYFFFDKLIQCNWIKPSYKEQVRIADFLTSLDKQISAISNRIASLKQMKEASLQSMFPKEGEVVPRVRFSGFTEDWMSSLANDIFKPFDERNRADLPVLSAFQDVRGMMPRDESGYEISHDKSNEKGYKHVLPGQFAIHLRSFQGGFAHSAYEGICSPAYTIFSFRESDKHHDYFWKYLFMSKSFIHKLKAITYGIRDGRTISFKEFGEMRLLLPSSCEQQKIATYFRNLDEQIRLETLRLEKLKNIKTACLDKMFV